MERAMRYFTVLLLVLAALFSISRESADAGSQQPVATCHPSLSGIALTRSSMPGGASDTARVTLSCAPRIAVTVGLRGFTGVSVRAAVTVARGKRSATATVRSAVTKVTRRGSIAATLGRTRRAAPLTVTKTPRLCKTPTLTGMSLARLAYIGDHPVARVSLNCAPFAPITLRFSSSSAGVQVPATVKVARYYNYSALPLVLGIESGQYSARITASYRGKSLSHTLIVDPGLKLVAIDPTIDFPDQISLAVITTSMAPAGGETVRLKSSSPAVTVPATFTVAAPSLGGEVPGLVVKQVSKDTKVTLSATLGSVTKSASYVLVPPFNGKGNDKVTIENELGPGPIYGLNHASYEYAVRLSNPAPASGESFTVVSSDPAALTVEGNTQSILPGGESAIFDVDTALAATAVHATLSVTVSGLHASVPVVIEPPLNSFSGVPASMTGGSSATMTLNMLGPVDVPTVVDLESTDGIATVPSSVTVPKGASSVSFAVTTGDVTTPTQFSVVAFILLSSEEVDSAQSSDITVNP